MKPVFDKENQDAIQKLLDEMPDPRACALPALRIAQQQFGYISDEVMKLVADTLSLPAEWIATTATFYTMYNKQPVGKYHIQICRNVSCFLRGSDAILKAFEQELGIGVGETTEDGLFTLSTVECLAACGTAPALQVNDTFHEEMTPEKVKELVRSLKEARA